MTTPKRQRRGIFGKHHDGERLLQDIIDGTISKAEAARILGCARSNITQYMKRHNLKVKDKPLPKKIPLNLTKSPPQRKVSKKPKGKDKDPSIPLNELADQTIELTEDHLKYLSPTDIKELQQLLMDKIRSGEIIVDFDQFMALSKEIRYNYALQLQHNLTNKKEDQVIKLNEKDVQELFDKIKEVHCNTCQYHQYFMGQRNTETTKERLASE